MANENQTPKRKTHTSSAVKRKYNQKVYASLYVQLPKELIYAFRERTEQLGVSRAQVVKEAIEAFLAKTDEARPSAAAEAKTDPQ